ncbi:MAG: ATP-binding protein [Syntrophales bacterium]|jgi:two-component system phosphate regulon sensor histidine kinase PhoR|nr:ATP-binding protein [Syntrophales bacterium]MCK9392114.1 ATP-binding protein [Syntrophales bacterium]
MKSRLFFKIFATYLILVLLVMAVMEFFLTPKIRETITRGVMERMIGHGRIMALMTLDEMLRKVTELAARSEARITIIDAAGKVLADSSWKDQKMDNHLNRPEVQEARLKGQGTAIRYSRTLQQSMLYVAVAVPEKDHIRGYVRLARSLEEVALSIEHLYRSIYLTLFLITIPSLILAFLFARNIASPVRRLMELTQKIRAGERPPPMMAESDDELGRLTQDINYIIEEQQEKIRVATEEKSKLEAAFDGMVEGVLTLDGDSRIDQFNRGLRKMVGKQRTDILGKTPLEAFRSADLQVAYLHFRETGETVRQEVALGDEKSLILDVNISAIKGYPGNEGKIMMVFHDVTRLKQLERMRMDFVANVTHEIRTPLTAIIGYIETLQQGAVLDREQTDRFLQTAHNNALRLNRLVDDLLTLSNIEMGEIKMQFQTLAVSEVIAEVLKTLAPQAAAKKITLAENFPEDVPPVRADRDRVFQIFLNILDNAVKFTPEGGAIKITTAQRDAETVSVRIADTGIGIPKNDLPRLGERFYRVEKTRSRDSGGTGLGLSIVKHLMAAHGGRVEIDSTPGQGTSVLLFFPVFIPEKENLSQG